jgi:hypothetical protein
VTSAKNEQVLDSLVLDPRASMEASGPESKWGQGESPGQLTSLSSTPEATEREHAGSCPHKEHKWKCHRTCSL